MSLNLNTDLALVTTTANAGTITLPLSLSIPGRVITFKDITQTFGKNALTLNTTSPDTFEDGGTTKVLRESGGIIQLVGTSNKWYVLAGTQQNTLNISSLLAISISTNTISSMNASVSTINFQNNVNSTLSLYQTSTLLYFNSNVFAGSKVLPGTLLTRYTNASILGPKTVNTSLFLWLDASDPNTVTAAAISSNVSQWNDKSGTGINFTNRFGGVFPTYVPNVLNGYSGVRIQGSNQGLISAAVFPTYTNSQISFFGLVRGVLNGDMFVSLNSFQYFGLSINATQIGGNLGRSGATTTFANSAINNTTNGGYNLLELIADSNGTGTLYGNGTAYQTSAITPLSYFQNDTMTFTRDVLTTDNYFLEVVAYRNALTALERQQVEGYIMWKWGIQNNLPSNHRYRYYSP